MSELPPLITSKGDANTEWTKAYMAQTGCTYLTAHERLHLNIANMPEPSLTTSRGTPNPVWMMWYRVRKRVSTNIARSACKKLIALSQEQGPESEKIRSDIHRRLHW